MSKLHTQPSRFFRFFSTIVLPRYQLVSLIVISLIIVTISYKPFLEYNPLEKKIPIIPLTPQQIQAWGVMPAQASVGIHIISFPLINFITNEFIFDGIIWFEFDPALISLSTVEKFSFEHGEILSKSEPYTQIIANRLFARYNIRVKFKADLDYHLFPFDDHRLDIILVNRYIQPSEMIYRIHSSFFTLSQKAIGGFSGWDVRGEQVRSGLSKAVLENYPTQKIVEHPIAIFSFGIIRSGVRNIFLILIPLIMIFFVGLFAFAFDPKTHSPTILGLTSAGITSLLAYRFVIERMSPQVGYFLFSDIVFTLFLLIALVEFVFAVMLVKFGKLTPQISLVRGILYIVINGTLIISWYYFINQYMPTTIM